MKGRRRERDGRGHVEEQLRGRISAFESWRARDRARIADLEREVVEARLESAGARAEVAELRAEVETMRRTLSYYQNSNTPPSAASLEHKRRKREVRLARERGELPPHKRPGGRPGHRGTSRRHAPTETERHRVGRGPCECGGRMEVTTAVRDIIDIPPPRPTETRHHVESATCADCGHVRRADSGLPASGSYGRGVIAAATSYFASINTYAGIALIMLEVHGIHMSKATVMRMVDGVATALEPEADDIVERIRESPHVHVDETSFPSSGRTHWTWVLLHGKLVAVVFSPSRGSLVLDMHLAGFRGVVITDGYVVYRVFDAGGMHQQCWAHELRAVEHAARMHGGRLPELHAALLALYRRARDTAVAPCPELRRAMEADMASLLDGYGGADAELERAVARLRRALPRLFAFCEHAGVAPTNNAAERALRHVVVRRKVSGQLKGGRGGGQAHVDPPDVLPDVEGHGEERGGRGHACGLGADLILTRHPILYMGHYELFLGEDSCSHEHNA